ncbi:hypothetical protein PR202_gb17267 [Eleusine coracana subsp. coracana]|uniref:Uncharacterized protein n=1 Tax=Eleusine coracana subsp. coracana TaxID=191504 RepID=A0AAV5F2A4_ELECO|nr:hypothetical protein PR202_gb17267 [Eleusine coracana subsp. coracana]
MLAREFRSRILSKLNLESRVPTVDDDSFANWWRRAVRKVPKEIRKGLNTVIILGGWTLWKHRNACTFDTAAPCIRILLKNFDDENHLWCLAGAARLRHLALGLVLVRGQVISQSYPVSGQVSKQIV